MEENGPPSVKNSAHIPDYIKSTTYGIITPY